MRHRRAAPIARHRARAPKERSLSPPPPRFLGSFPRADVELKPPLPEIAFAGRSNVGKSSLLNALLGRPLARVSVTPGKTRALNVFAASEGHYVLDLPGYGYARAGKAQRAAHRRLVAHTLSRPHLVGVVWLLDLRHEPSAEDRAMLDLLTAAGTAVLAALTKSDKLPRGRRLEREREIRQTLGLEADQIITTSARTGEGVEELRETVARLIHEEAA